MTALIVFKCAGEMTSCPSHSLKQRTLQKVATAAATTVLAWSTTVLLAVLLLLLLGVLIAFNVAKRVDEALLLIGGIVAGFVYIAWLCGSAVVLTGEWIGWVSFWVFGDDPWLVTWGARLLALLSFFTVAGWLLVVILANLPNHW